jgi:superfamily II DNA or RNA helicase
MSGKRFYMFCPQEECNFTNRLPIQIIDEELYNNPPTLLFGTVDKFAMLPWDGRIGSFFGNTNESRSPELIIQDELHLISSALGTMVGLYETAVDAICGQKGIAPKIIASTATIRRAKEQCSVLYNREIVQFPAPGLNADDSFFAREAEISYENGIFGRKYVGIMPSGKTKAMTEIRAMASLLQKAYTMNIPDEVKDKLWTLTVYFNSLKDLGKTSTLVDDDVKDFIIRTANRMFTLRRLIVGSDELTSRVTTTELNETLDKLEKLEYSKKNMEDKRYASNVLLATNMISVGIDVARLNVMLMVGQPKLTSEYIQASSRVGRSFPGVAFIQYDATKSRDRSHYERFKSYHESFYRFVEPTGATPFSKPARERALHAVLIAMLRQRTGLIEDKDAIDFDKEYFSDIITDIEQFIINRIKNINARAGNGAKDDVTDVKREIESFFNEWQKAVDDCNESGEILAYYFGRRFMVKPPAAGLKRLLKQYNSIGNDVAFETMTSMRNVDTQVNGEIIIWEN